MFLYLIVLAGAEPGGGQEGAVATATTDLSLATPLATPLKTAVFVPFFFLDKKYIY